MNHVPPAFEKFFPDLARKETRVVTLAGPNPKGHEPGPNAFIQYYCTDPNCDCRNVYIQIINERFRAPLATISYGWDSKAYYKEWMGAADEDELLTDFMGHSLFVSRLQRHYQLMKSHVKSQK